MKKNILEKGISGLLGIVIIMTLFSVIGSAAVGDLLRTITTPVPAPGGVATSVGFDGASLYYTNWDQTNLYKIDAMGNLLATIPMTKSGMPLSFVTSLSWDSSRNKFWASAGGPLYLLDPNTGVAVFQFNSVGFDGLAWDGSDDTLWFSADANPMVHHTTTTGIELAGSPFNSGISNSGIAAGLPVGGKSFLYLGSNGVGKIYKYSKPPILANQIGVFASVGGRDENLACDSASFPGKNALWSKDAYNNKLFAYEVELGTCISPPPPGKPKLGSISGMKFNDLNGNGIKDMGEPGLANWTITLTNQSGNTVNTMTDANGNYSFTNLSDGNYTVGEILKPGWIQTAPAVSATGSATYTVNISGGKKVVGKDFGNFKLGEIHGMKWEDLNANGIKDPNETGLAGWNITINGTDTITGERVNITTTTDANGSYWFMNLTAGTYVISEESKCKLEDDDTEDDHNEKDNEHNSDNNVKDNEHNNDHNVKDNENNNDNNEKSRVCWVQTWPATGNYTVKITSGTVITGLDFGNFKQGKITGGGDIPANGEKATFGLEAQYPDDKNTPKGEVEYHDQAKKLEIESIQINTVATTMDRKKGVITGLAKVNGAGSYPFEVYVEDNGEPGKGVDVFKISLPTYPYSNGAILSDGNIQIHS